MTVDDDPHPEAWIVGRRIVGSEIERNIIEGKYHQGESAVVQVVACKAN